MTIRIPFVMLFAVLGSCLFTACNHEKVVLEKVRYLPDYMFIKNHFGTDLRSMEERNEFILVTGTIDTTSELPPVDVAVIIIDKKEQVLHRSNAVINNNEISEKYSGNGYTLTLDYKKGAQHLFTVYEGKLVISKGLSSTEYPIIGLEGYH